MKINPSKSLITFLLVLVGLAVQSQTNKTANNWNFGFNGALTFNNGSPQPVNGGEMASNEGCASISNNQGQLLFYTNGVSVWNRNNIIMPNGIGLLGCESSTMSCIIIPTPGDSSKYYIFTADCEENYNQGGYNYSIVDITMDNGLGDVVSKNNFLYKPSTEKLTATQHSDGISYWIVAKDSGTNRFRSYLIDCNGVNMQPVISDAGYTAGGGWRHFWTTNGYMKLSPNGRKLANVVRSSVNAVQLFDFDNSTGIITNPITIDHFDSVLGGDTINYGLEFSPNSRLLYLTLNNGHVFPYVNKINQFDISSGNQATINASKYSFDASGIFYTVTGALQLGPDGKIYTANYCAGFDTPANLSVINNPNVQGFNCNYSESSVNTGNGFCGSGLPVFVSSTFNTNPVNLDFTSSFIDCHVLFSGSASLTGNIKWKWDFGDGGTDSLQTVQHSFKRTGSYDITLTIFRSAACGIADSFKITKTVAINNVFSVDFNYSGSCVNESIQFNDSTQLTLGNITGYSWDFGDGTPLTTGSHPLHSFLQTGAYNVKLVISTNGVCNADSIIKTVFVDSRPSPNFNTNSGCVNKPVSFTDASSITTGSIAKWLWDFGDGNIDYAINPVHTYNNPGNFSVRLTTGSLYGCEDSILIPIVIENKPIANFTFGVSCVNQPTAFTDLSVSSTGNIVKWDWDFGDGSIDSIKNPEHMFANAGSHNVSLYTTSQNGCVAEIKTLPVLVKEVVAFAGRDTFALYNQPLQLNASGGEFYLWQPSTGLSNPGIANPLVTLVNDAIYIVKVNSIEGCIGYDTINITVFKNLSVFIPTAFSPGNTINNVFKPLGEALAKIEYFRIYNRYGQLLFETNKLNVGWDGKFKGIEQQAGAYVYCLRFVTTSGKLMEREGNFLLIR